MKKIKKICLSLLMLCTTLINIPMNITIHADVTYATTFTLSDWVHTETPTDITLTKYIGSEKDLYVPGEFNGKQVLLNGIQVLKITDMETLHVEKVNGKQVKLKNPNSGIAYAFSGVTTLKAMNLNGLDVSSTPNMSSLFNGISSLEILEIEDWDTSSATNTSNMFYHLTSLKELNINNWNVSGVNNMYGMFEGCTSLESLLIGDWNVTSVTNMGAMFKEVESLETLDIGRWTTSSLKLAGNMFEGAKKIDGLDLNGWDMQNVTTVGSMFKGCESLKELSISSWDLSNTTNLSTMFAYTDITFLDLSGWQMHATPMMGQIFTSTTQKPLTIIGTAPQLLLPNYALTMNRTQLNASIKLDAGLGEFSDSSTQKVLGGTFPYVVANINDVMISDTDYNAFFSNNVPTYVGHTFDGWDIAPDSYSGTKMISELEGTHTAKYRAIDYSINYNLDGGINDSSNPKTYTFGVGVDSFVAPTKTGYSFGGWYTDVAHTTLITSISTTQTGVVDMYAKWVANEYTINYHLDGGINDPSNPLIYTYGIGVSSFIDPMKVGYTFDGWFEDAAFTTPITNIAGTRSGTIDLYAKWIVNEYPIHYHLDGGINNSSNPTTYTYGVGVTSFVAPTKTGYSFGGWYADVAHTTPITSILTTQTGVVDMYAKWIANEYTLTYHLDGGVNNPSNPTTYTFGVGVPSLADPTKDGYTFKGWYIDPAYAMQITSISTVDTNNWDLYAKWEVNDYSITYHLDGGINNPSNPLIYTYGVGVASFIDPVKVGYTFDGWFEDVSFTSPITNISTTHTGDVDVYAKWSVDDYAIHYHLDGGINGSNPTTYTYGVGVTSLANPTKVGYTFGGWYTDATFTTLFTNISTTQTGDVDVYAKWSVNEYPIIYHLDGGTNGSNPTTYTYGIGVSSFVAPTKAGYSFGGWYTNATFTTQITSISTTQTGNVNMYAKWTEDTKTLIIKDDFKANDNILVVYRSGDTKETSSLFPSGYSYEYDIKLEINGSPITTTQLKDVTWKVEATGNCSNILTYATIKNGTNKLEAKRTGVVKLTATYKGSSATIDVVIPGDVTRDGVLNTADALRIQNYASSKTPNKDLLGVNDKYTEFMADMSGDGIINTADKVVIQKMIAKTIKPSN